MSDNLAENIKNKSSLRTDREEITNLLSFFNSSPDLLFVFDSEGIIIEANRTAYEKLQYTRSELLGKTRYILYTSEHREDAERCLKENLSGKRNFCPLPLKSKSGEQIFVETILSKGKWNGNDAVFSVSKDITEKRRAEITARKIEERYQILFGNINDAVFVHELTEDGLPGRFLEVNDIACERLGYSRKEILTMSPKDIDAPESLGLVPEIMKKLGKENHIVWEGVHLTKKGIRIPVEISNHLFKMEDKPVILSTVRDITDRKSSEEMLKRSEEKYRKIFENVQDIFYQADINGKIVEISPSIERYSGYKSEELIGMKIEEVYLNPDDRGELLKILSRKGEIEDYILKLRTKDKREVFVSANIHMLYDEERNAVGVEGSLRDVSARLNAEEKLKASEKLLRDQNEEYVKLNEELKKKNEQILLINKELQQAADIFMNIRTGLYIYHLENPEDDSTLRMIAVNPASERLTGISAKDVIGKTLDENFPGLREKGIPSEYANVARTKISKQFEDIIYNDDRVAEGAFTFNAFPLPDNCVGISFENITEQIKSREATIESNRQLKIAKEKAEESDMLKSAFLANMSHEIRTPMSGIVGFSIMLADPELPAETRETYIKIINSSCDQLLHIINDIIDISKIEAGQIDIYESTFDLKELLDEVYLFYSPVAQENGVTLILNSLSENLFSNRQIISDRTKLRQVLDNLLSNAVKFTHSGNIIIRCELKEQFLQFEIKDTGIGIDPELQNAVFERFRQVETTLTKRYGGTGLGLSITKAYVEKMGGKIGVHSVLGKGSAFFFSLPYTAAISEVKQELKSRPEIKSHPLKGEITVLVVEDEEINWFYLYEILKDRVKTLRAENGITAIELVKQHPEIDIVLMDIKLPDINGLELTGILKSVNNKIEVIAQTAYALSGDREMAIAAGCSDYITKPVNREDLLRLIAVYSGK